MQGAVAGEERGVRRDCETASSTATAMMVAMSPSPIALVIRKPKPRREANISPISTPEQRQREAKPCPDITSAGSPAARWWRRSCAGVSPQPWKCAG